jgi:hypothetical protein
MTDQIKTLITDNQIKSDNSSGTTILYLMRETKASYDAITPVLKQLHADKYIVFRKGVNNALIFLRNHTKKR